MQEMQAMQVQSSDWEDPLEEGMATHSSVLAWRIPWTEEPGGLQSMELQRVRRDWSNLARMHVFSFLLGLYLGVELLGLVVTLCLTFKGTARLFSKAAAGVYAPDSCV